MKVTVTPYRIVYGFGGPDRIRTWAVWFTEDNETEWLICTNHTLKGATSVKEVVEVLIRNLSDFLEDWEIEGRLRPILEKYK